MKKGDIIRRISGASKRPFGAFFIITDILKDGMLKGYCIENKKSIGDIGRKTDHFKIYSIISVLVSDEVFFANTNPLASTIKIWLNEKSKVLLNKNPDLVKIYTKGGKYIIIQQDGIYPFEDYWANQKIKIYYDRLVDQEYGK